MLSKDLRGVYLVDELQLGGRLNRALNEQDRADFSLMLALLSQDVTDAPLSVMPSGDAPPKPEDLRHRFMLPKAQPLYGVRDDYARSAGLADLLNSEQGDIRGVFLTQCLAPEPLVPFESIISPEVMSDLPPLSQEKLRRRNEGQLLTYERVQEQGEGFEVLGEIAYAREGPPSSVDDSA